MAFGGLVKDSVALYALQRVINGGPRKRRYLPEEQSELASEILWVYFVLVPRSVFWDFPRWVARGAITSYSHLRGAWGDIKTWTYAGTKWEQEQEQEPPPPPQESPF